MMIRFEPVENAAFGSGGDLDGLRWMGVCLINSLSWFGCLTTKIKIKKRQKKGSHKVSSRATHRKWWANYELSYYYAGGIKVLKLLCD